MRKLTILLAVAALAASSAGCGRCRNLFHKGSPCGTTVTSPAMLTAPLAMGAVSQPMCVDPCMQYDPCATGATGTYFGGYMPSGADCNCDPAAGGAIQVVPTPQSVMPGGQGYPAPGA
jgi:hypothetical protein